MTKKLLILFLLLGAALRAAEPPGTDEAFALDDALSVLTSTEAAPAPPPEALPPPAPLRILHPPEGARLPAVARSFVYGSADPAGRLTLNGRPVPIDPGGGFLAMIDYSSGPFEIFGELAISSAVYPSRRRVFVVDRPRPTPADPLTIESVRPDQDMELLDGDRVAVAVKGSPGVEEASFQVDGVKGKFPLVAAGGGVAGVYEGVYVVRPADALNGSRIKVTLKGPAGKETRWGEGRLSRFSSDPPVVAEVTSDLAILTAGPGRSVKDRAGYVMYPPPGVRLELTGRRGEEYRVRLSARREVWVLKDDVRLLPPGTLPPEGKTGSVNVIVRGTHVEARLAVGEKVPFEIRADPDGAWIEAVLYGLRPDTDWMNLDPAAAGVGPLEWFQDEVDVFRWRVHTAPGSWWGYDARYEAGAFVLELRRPVPMEDIRRPLAGLTVAVDAGHSSDRGAVGVTGLLEKDANRDIAACLKEKLEAEGARAVLIRPADEHVDLYERPKRAWAARADILVSVHNNALPEGGDPFERNGYGVYYFYSHSLPLARMVHAEYGRVVGREGRKPVYGLRDDGLHYGNLALARTPQMPAILTESAYMIVPREEALLKTRDFQCACAEAMLQGMRSFAAARRPRAPSAQP